MRLDRFLWWARLTKTRAQAAALAAEGHLRLDGRAIDRAHADVRVGSVLALPLRGQVRVFRVDALPARRGPPAEARALYTDLVDGPPSAPLGPPVSPPPASSGP
jgi:ribosome-associated heat shock protein Hsp15